MADATCIAAGFFVTKTVARDAHGFSDLLPPPRDPIRCTGGWDVEKCKSQAAALSRVARLPNGTLSGQRAAANWTRRHHPLEGIVAPGSGALTSVSAGIAKVLMETALDLGVAIPLRVQLSIHGHRSRWAHADKRSWRVHGPG
jgi:hypothetical protein